MPVILRIDAHDIAETAAAVRKLGDGRQVMIELTREIRAAVPPVRRAVRDNATRFPHGGHLDRWVGRAGLRAQVKRGWRTAGITLLAGRNSSSGRAELNRLDLGGMLRHPLWGNRSFWYSQTVASGWFSEGIESQFDEFTNAAVRAIDTARGKVGL